MKENIKFNGNMNKKVKCPHCGSYNTVPLTKDFGKRVIKNAIFCYECDSEAYYE